MSTNDSFLCVLLILTCYMYIPTDYLTSCNHHIKNLTYPRNIPSASPKSKMTSYTYIRTYIHTYIHTYIPTYLHTYIPTYLHTYIPTYLHTYIPTYLRASMHPCIHASIHTLYIHPSIHPSIHTCISFFTPATLSKLLSRLGILWVFRVFQQRP